MTDRHAGRPCQQVGVRLLPGVAEITSHADVKAAAKDPAALSSALLGDVDVRSYRQLPLEADPPEHAAYRAILTPVFARQAVATLEAPLRAVAAAVVRGFAARGAADAVRDLALPMVAASIAIAFGRPQDTAELEAWGTTSWEVLPDGRRDGSRLERYLERVFAEVDATPGDDAFSRIAQARMDGRPLSRDERFGLGNLILAGGRDTVIGLISGAVWHLADHPAERSRLAADPAAIPSAVEEMLRYLSPLQRMERLATADVSGSWGSAQAGDIVLLGFAAANHDAAVFDEPSRIDLQRSPNPHVAFGNGPHTCIGVHLARLEARVFLEELVAAVPEWHLAGQPAIAWESIAGVEVPVRFDHVPVAAGA
jgi:cytochrome P450